MKMLGPENGSEAEDDKGADDLEEQIVQQKSRIGELKDAMRKDEEDKKNKAKELLSYSAKFSQRKLKQRSLSQDAASLSGLADKVSPSQENLKQDMVQLVSEGEIAKSPEDASRSIKVKRGRTLLLQRQNEEIRQKIQRKTQQLRELPESVISSLEIRKDIQMDETDSQSEEKFSEVVYQVQQKDKKIVELNNQVLECERKILDLQESLNEKDSIIDARTQAITLMSADWSKKGQTTLDALDETRDEMRQMQLNFIATETKWKEEKQKLNQEIQEKDHRISHLEQLNQKLEAARFDLSTRNATLQENIVRLQTDLSAFRESTDQQVVTELRENIQHKQGEIEQLEQKLKDQKLLWDDVNKQLLKTRTLLKTKTTAFEKQIKQLQENQTDGDILTSLQNQIAVLEEEKGNLQLKLVDFDELKSDEVLLRNRVEELEKQVQLQGDDLDQHVRALHLLESEKLDLVEALNKQNGLTESLQNSLEESKQNCIALELRLVELEEQRDTAVSRYEETISNSAEKDSSYDTMAKDIINLQTQLSAVREELEVALTEKATFYTQLDRANASLETHIQETDTLQTTLNIKIEELVSKQEEVTTLVDLVRKRDEETADLTDQITQFTEAMNEKNRIIANLEQSVQLAKLEIDQVRKTAADVQEEEKSGLLQKISSLENQLEFLQKNKDSSVTEMECKLQDQETIIAELTEKVQNQVVLVSTKENEISDFSCRFGQMETQLNEKQEHIMELVNSLHEKDVLIVNNSSTISQLQKSLEENQNLIEGLKMRTADLDREHTEHVTLLTGKSNEIEQQKVRETELELSLEELKGKLHKTKKEEDRLNQDLQEKAAHIEMQNVRDAELKSAFSQIKQEFQSMIARCKETKGELSYKLDHTEVQGGSLEEVLAELEKVKAEYEEVLEDLKNKSEEIRLKDEKEAELQTLKVEHEQVQVELDGKSKEIEMLKEKEIELVSSFEKLESKFNTLKVEHERVIEGHHVQSAEVSPSKTEHPEVVDVSPSKTEHREVADPSRMSQEKNLQKITFYQEKLKKFAANLKLRTKQVLERDELLKVQEVQITDLQEKWEVEQQEKDRLLTELQEKSQVLEDLKLNLGKKEDESLEPWNKQQLPQESTSTQTEGRTEQVSILDSVASSEQFTHYICCLQEELEQLTYEKDEAQGKLTVLESLLTERNEEKQKLIVVLKEVDEKLQTTESRAHAQEESRMKLEVESKKLLEDTNMLQEELQSKVERISTMKTELEEKTSKITELEENLQEKDENLQVFAKEIDRAKIYISQLEADLQETAEFSERLSAEKAEVMKNLDTELRKVAGLKETVCVVEDMQNREEELLSRVNELTSLQDITQQEKRQLEEEVFILKGASGVSQSEIQKLQTEKEEQEKNTTKFIADIEKFEKERTNLLEELSNVSQKVTEAEIHVQSLEKRCMELEDSNKKSQETVSELTVAIEKLEIERNSLTNELDTVSQKLTEEQRKSQTSDESFTDLSDRNQKLLSENKHLQSDLQSSKQFSARCETQNNMLQERLKVITGQLNRLQLEQQELISNAESEYRQEIESLKLVVAEKQGELVDLSEKLAEKQGELLDLSEKLLSLELCQDEQVREADSRQSELLEVRSQLAERNATLANLKLEKEELVSRVGQMTQQVQLLQSDSAEHAQRLTVQLQDKEQEISRQISELEGYETLKSESEMIREDCTVLRNEKINLQMELQTLEDKFKMERENFGHHLRNELERGQALQSEISVLQEYSLNQEKEKGELQRKVEELKIVVQQHQDQILQLTAELESSKSQVMVVSQQVETVETNSYSQVTYLTNELALMTSEKEQVSKTVAHLQELIKNKENVFLSQLSESENKIISLQRELDSQHSAIQHVHQTVDELREYLRASESLMTAVKSELQEKEKLLEEVTQTALSQASSSDMDSLREELKSVSAKLSQVEAQNTQLLEDLQVSKVKSGKMLQKLKAFKEKNDSLLQENNKLKNKASTGLDEALEEEMHARIQKAEKMANDAEKAANEAKQKEASLLLRIDTLEGANEKFIELKETQDTEVHHLHSRCSTLQQQVSALEWQLAEAQEILENQNNTDNSSSNFEVENEKRRCELDEKQHEIQKLSSTVGPRSVLLEHGQVQQTASNEEYFRVLVGEKEQQLTSAITELHETREQKEILSEDLTRLSKEVQMKDDKIASLKQQVSSLTVSYNELLIQYETSQHECSQLKLSAEKIQSEKYTTLQEKSELLAECNKQNREIQMMAEENEAVNQVVKSLKAEKLDVETQLSQKTEELQILKTLKEKLESEVINLRQVEESYSLMQDSYESLKLEYNTVYSSFVDTQEKYDSLKIEFDLTSGEKAQLHRENSQLKEHIQNISEDSESKEILLRLQEELKQLHQQNSEQQVELQNKSKQSESREADFQSREVQFRQDAEILHNKFAEVQEENIRLQKSFRETQDQLELQESKTQQQKLQSEHQVTELLEKVSELQTVCSELERSLEEKQELVSELEYKMSVFEELQKEEHKHKEVESLQATVSQLHSELNTISKEKYDLENQLKEYSREAELQQTRSVLNDGIDIEIATQNLQEEIQRVKEENRRLIQQSEIWRHHGVNSQDPSSLQTELRVAMTTLHQRDQKCEQLTVEITRLLEERDALQLKLSSQMRYNQKLQRELTGTPTLSSESSQDGLSPNLNSQDVTELNAKLTELQETNYTLDVRLKEEQEERARVQEQLRRSLSWQQSTQQLSSWDQSTLELMPATEADDFLDEHPPLFVDKDYTVSRDIQSPARVLMNWLTGRSIPRVLHV